VLLAYRRASGRSVDNVAYLSRFLAMTEPVRVTPQLLVLLDCLTSSAGASHYGFSLCQATGLKSGTLYPLLARLERAGFLESGWEDAAVARPGPRRRYYRLTADGAASAKLLIAESRQGTSRRRQVLRPAIVKPC
jgi:DNA-binding MarR family transcriptional regulator